MKRVLSRMLVAGGLMLGASATLPSLAAEGPAKPDATRGANLYEQGDASRGIIACASCHGAAGDSTISANPKLAGQHEGYLRRQLNDFRPGPEGAAPARVSVVMNPLAAPLNDQDVANLAYYLAQQTVKTPATAGHEDLVELGQEIWRGGIAAKGVPACAACHGANGNGMDAQYPYLRGQFSSYIQAQLEAFRSGQRTNNQPMHDIAIRMTDAEIRAVSDYAAGLR